MEGPSRTWPHSTCATIEQTVAEIGPCGSLGGFAAAFDRLYRRNGFEMWKSIWYLLWSLVQRSSVPNLVNIGQELGWAKGFYTFPGNPKWRPRQFGYYKKLSMVRLGISQDIKRQRNDCIKVNTSTVVGKNTCMLPATPPLSHMT